MKDEVSVVFDEDEILNDPAEKIGCYITSKLWKAYYENLIKKIVVVASPKFYDWILEYWPHYYLTGVHRQPSKLKWLFTLLKLPDYLEKTRVYFVPSQESVGILRQDILENDRFTCFGSYFSLRRLDI